MAQSPQEYFTALFKEAGYDDATISTVLPHFTNEKVSGKLGGLLKTAQDDYHAQVGRSKAAQDRVTQYDQWYATEKPKNDALQSELALLKAQLGGGGSNGYSEPPAFDASKYLTKDDLARFAVDQSTRTATVIKSVGRLASRHAAKFNEELDVDALEEIATKKGLPLEAAYNEYIAPREDERRNKDLEARIKAARDEGAREALSRHKLPVDAVPQESAPVIGRWNKQSTESAKPATDGELLEAWNSVGHK